MTKEKYFKRMEKLKLKDAKNNKKKVKWLVKKVVKKVKNSSLHYCSFEIELQEDDTKAAEEILNKKFDFLTFDIDSYESSNLTIILWRLKEDNYNDNRRFY